MKFPDRSSEHPAGSLSKFFYDKQKIGGRFPVFISLEAGRSVASVQKRTIPAAFQEQRVSARRSRWVGTNVVFQKAATVSLSK